MRADSIISYKELGETPLEALERTRSEHGIGAGIPMTYAGRLDPMAEGVIIILVGEECKKKEQYLGLDKTYEFEVLVGFQTDTHDLLGLLKETSSEESFLQVLGSPRLPARPDHSENLSSDFVSALESFVGMFTQKYPKFSSKTVGGKQLFQRALDDELPDEMPEHEVTIYSLQCTSTGVREKEELHKEILRRISLVKGDFRQEEIIEKWNEAFDNSKEKEFTIFKCACECSSGTYIRQLVADVSKKLGIPLVTYSIKRTKVGEFKSN